MNSSKVSIIIPTYKRSDRIEKAVKSAINQNYTNFEVIVVDDNEPDSIERKATEKVLEKYLTLYNFKYIKHTHNKNGAAARNTGIENSSGEYITFLDDDDEYYENKIAIQSKALDELEDDWGLVYTSYEKIDQYNNLQRSTENAEGNVLIQVLTKNLFIGSGSNFMIRRRVVNEINGFDEKFERNQDLEFLVRALMNYKIKFVDTVTFLIHNEIRERKFSYEELENINTQYKEKFKDLILSLSNTERDEVFKTLSLLDIRTALSYKHFIEAYKIYKKSPLNFSDILKYVKYLVNRVIHKTSYGFRLSN